MNKLFVVYSQHSDENPELYKACEEKNLPQALNEIGKERLKFYEKICDGAWFVGFALIYSHDQVLNSPNRGESYLNHIVLKFQIEKSGNKENIDETLYVSPVDVFEKKFDVKTENISSVLTQSQKDRLSEVYGKLWVEACYDPESEQLRKFCTPLSKIMQDLNQELKFKL